MKTGIIRRMDELGRIVVPKEIRRKLNLREGDPLEITLDGDKVCFELYTPYFTYEESINRIIENLELDDDFSTDKTKAISALKEACKALQPPEKGGGSDA